MLHDGITLTVDFKVKEVVVGRGDGEFSFVCFC